MNLLILCNKIPYPPNDGGSIATLYLAQGLSKFIADIDLLSINTKKHFFDIKNIPEQIKKNLNFYDIYADTSLSLFKLLKNLFFSSLPYNAERFILKNFELKLIKLLSEKKYDIIQIEGLYMLPYISTVRKYSNALISYRAHNIEQEIWIRRYKQMRFSPQKIYLNILIKRLMKFEQSFINKYDILIPISDKDSEKFNSLKNIKPKITIPTGLKPEDYEIKNHKIDFPSLFHIGALDWTPNQEALIWFLENVWHKVNTQMPKLKFYIAGRNAPKWFEKKIRRKNVIFLGEIDDAKKFISTKAIMIVPLLSGSGMRIKILEGMALSKAIISTTIGLEGIKAIDKQHVFIADSAEEMTNTILDLSDNFEKVKNIGQNARIFVFKNFDNFVVAKELFCFYVKNLKSVC